MVCVFRLGQTAADWASPGGALPQWIYVDLGEDMTLKHVLLDWEAADGIDYSLRGRTAAQGTSTDPFGVDRISDGEWLRASWATDWTERMWCSI